MGLKPTCSSVLTSIVVDKRRLGLRSLLIPFKRGRFSFLYCADCINICIIKEEEVDEIFHGVPSLSMSSCD